MSLRTPFLRGEAIPKLLINLKKELIKNLRVCFAPYRSLAKTKCEKNSYLIMIKSLEQHKFSTSVSLRIPRCHCEDKYRVIARDSGRRPQDRSNPEVTHKFKNQLIKSLRDCFTLATLGFAMTKSNSRLAMKRTWSAVILITFISSSVVPPRFVYAQSILSLPAPGTMISLSPKFTPILVRGITIDPQNPLKLSFIVDSGNEKLTDDQFKTEADRLIKYFFACLTVPEKDMWVNLSPHEKGRIIPNEFGITEAGRDLLAQDYILKQLTASLIYPEDELGKKFWEKVYKQAYEQYGTTDIPVNTFNKVWIIPDKALVVESGNTAFVAKSHLKVMLEEDYLGLNQNLNNKDIGTDTLKTDDVQKIGTIGSKIIKELILPAIEKEVNEGKNFSNLRQINQSMILATWYKRNLKESLLGKVYIDQNKVKGIDLEDKTQKEKIYQQYLEAIQKGVYNFIKEDFDPNTQETLQRKYFAGGFQSQHAKIDAAMPVENAISQGLVTRKDFEFDSATVMNVDAAVFEFKDDKGLLTLKPLAEKSADSAVARQKLAAASPPTLDSATAVEELKNRHQAVLEKYKGIIELTYGPSYKDLDDYVDKFNKRTKEKNMKGLRTEIENEIKFIQQSLPIVEGRPVEKPGPGNVAEEKIVADWNARINELLPQLKNLLPEMEKSSQVDKLTKKIDRALDDLSRKSTYMYDGSAPRLKNVAKNIQKKLQAANIQTSSEAVKFLDAVIPEIAGVYKIMKYSLELVDDKRVVSLINDLYYTKALAENAPKVQEAVDQIQKLFEEENNPLNQEESERFKRFLTEGLVKVSDDSVGGVYYERTIGRDALLMNLRFTLASFIEAIKPVSARVSLAEKKSGRAAEADTVLIGQYSRTIDGIKSVIKDMETLPGEWEALATIQARPDQRQKELAYFSAREKVNKAVDPKEAFTLIQAYITGPQFLADIREMNKSEIPFDPTVRTIEKNYKEYILLVGKEYSALAKTAFDNREKMGRFIEWFNNLNLFAAEIRDFDLNEVPPDDLNAKDSLAPKADAATAILVVEDTSDIVPYLIRMGVDPKYIVKASDGNEALEIYKKDPSKFVRIITDLNMDKSKNPKPMNGDIFAAHVKQFSSESNIPLIPIHMITSSPQDRIQSLTERKANLGLQEVLKFDQTAFDKISGILKEDIASIKKAEEKDAATTVSEFKKSIVQILKNNYTVENSIREKFEKDTQGVTTLKGLLIAGQNAETLISGYIEVLSGNIDALQKELTAANTESQKYLNVQKRQLKMYSGAQDAIKEKLKEIKIAMKEIPKASDAATAVSAARDNISGIIDQLLKDTQIGTNNHIPVNSIPVQALRNEFDEKWRMNKLETEEQIISFLEMVIGRIKRSLEIGLNYAVKHEQAYKKALNGMQSVQGELTGKKEILNVAPLILNKPADAAMTTQEKEQYWVEISQMRNALDNNPYKHSILTKNKADAIKEFTMRKKILDYINGEIKSLRKSELFNGEKPDYIEAISKLQTFAIKVQADIEAAQKSVQTKAGEKELDAAMTVRERFSPLSIKNPIVKTTLDNKKELFGAIGADPEKAAGEFREEAATDRNPENVDGLFEKIMANVNGAAEAYLKKEFENYRKLKEVLKNFQSNEKAYVEKNIPSLRIIQDLKNAIPAWSMRLFATMFSEIEKQNKLKKLTTSKETVDFLVKGFESRLPVVLLTAAVNFHRVYFTQYSQFRWGGVKYSNRLGNSPIVLPVMTGRFWLSKEGQSLVNDVESLGDDTQAILNRIESDIESLLKANVAFNDVLGIFQTSILVGPKNKPTKSPAPQTFAKAIQKTIDDLSEKADDLILKTARESELLIESPSYEKYKQYLMIASRLKAYEDLAEYLRYKTKDMAAQRAEAIRAGTLDEGAGSIVKQLKIVERAKAQHLPIVLVIDRSGKIDELLIEAISGPVRYLSIEVNNYAQAQKLMEEGDILPAMIIDNEQAVSPVRQKFYKEMLEKNISVVKLSPETDEAIRKSLGNNLGGVPVVLGDLKNIQPLINKAIKESPRDAAVATQIIFVSGNPMNIDIKEKLPKELIGASVIVNTLDEAIRLINKNPLYPRIIVSDLTSDEGSMTTSYIETQLTLRVKESPWQLIYAYKRNAPITVSTFPMLNLGQTSSDQLREVFLRAKEKSEKDFQDIVDRKWNETFLNNTKEAFLRVFDGLAGIKDEKGNTLDISGYQINVKNAADTARLVHELKTFLNFLETNANVELSQLNVNTNPYKTFVDELTDGLELFEYTQKIYTIISLFDKGSVPDVDKLRSELFMASRVLNPSAPSLIARLARNVKDAIDLKLNTLAQGESQESIKEEYEKLKAELLGIAKELEAPTTDAASAVALKREETTVLLVDDNENSRKSVEDVLKKNGYTKFLYAENGKQALKILNNPANKIDIVVSDVNMPEMDGFKLASSMMASKIPAPIILTSNDLSNIELAKIKGFTAFFRGNAIKELDKLIQKKLNPDLKRNQEATVKILVVDDTELIREDARRNIQREFPKATILEAVNGQEALEILRKEKISLVVSDVQMPGITGLQLADEIHKDTRLRDTPIIIMTSDREINMIPDKYITQHHLVGIVSKRPDDGDFYDNLLDAVKKEVEKIEAGEKRQDAATSTNNLGGIDLNSANLDLQIKRDGNGIPLPMNLQPIETMHIEGFVPVIINITPIKDLPFLSGIKNLPIGSDNTIGFENTHPVNSTESQEMSYANLREEEMELVQR